MHTPPFFWLHIKKSAGGSVRRALTPWYVGAQRGHRPVNFIQSPPEQWNDILNNYRIPLGPYQFRRALFAHRYLYPHCWNSLLRFAFVREPVSRAVSAFFYLREMRGGERSFVQHLTEAGYQIPDNDFALFDLFLDLVEAARASNSVYDPVNLHFTTHTAPMWDDVMDEEGQLLLSHVFRLEDMNSALNAVFDACGIDKRLTGDEERINAQHGSPLVLNPAQRARIETLYAKDFDLYEGACKSL